MQVSVCLSRFLQLIRTMLLTVNWGAYVIFLDLLIPSTLDDHLLLPCDLREEQRDTGAFRDMVY